VIFFPFKKRIKESLKTSKSRGFTLVELLVTVVIFVVLTGVVLFSQTNFDNSILLSNLAYDVGLTVRQAQTYGVNVKEFSTSTTGTFSMPYGVYFDITKGGNNKSFILFANTVNDTKFSGEWTCYSDDIECVQKYTIKKGSYISGLCAGTNSSNCSSSNTLSILFQRPYPDANIYVGDELKTYNYAEITVSSADGSATKTIVVTKAGQIYVAK